MAEIPCSLRYLPISMNVDLNLLEGNLRTCTLLVVMLFFCLFVHVGI